MSCKFVVVIIILKGSLKFLFHMFRVIQLYLHLMIIDTYFNVRLSRSGLIHC